VGAGGAPATDGGGTSGAGGAPATDGGGGTGGAGGSDAGGDAAGAGGSNGPYSCTPGVSPPMPLLADFSASSWNATTRKWGFAGNLTGPWSTYKGLMSGTAIAGAVMNESLTITGNIAAGDYAGILMSFDACVNTTTYTGLQFTLTGSAAGCDLFFAVQTFSQQTISNRGGCNLAGNTCLQFPRVKVAVSTTPTIVHFSSLAGTGLPATAAGIAAEIVGLQWSLQSPSTVPQAPCQNFSLAIDDVGFVSN
jgi:hypothetical protein